jgi:hypothetical protein
VRVLCVSWGCAAALVTIDARADQEAITGREEERRMETEAGADVGDALLFAPREALRYMLLAHLIVARFAHDRQVVPLRSEDDEPHLYVFPTLFVETERPLSVGLRMVAAGGPFATSHRVGFGGPRDLVAESEVQYADAVGGVPLAVGVEGLAESKTELEYLGIGQTPREDVRNHFIADYDRGLYEERRTRGIVNVGVRPVHEVQINTSASLTRRQIEDDHEDEDDGAALSQVFAPGTVPGWGPDTWLTYMETALRIDTREHAGPPLPGFMAEVYGGYAHQVRGIEIALARTGGRMAGFIPVYRKQNLLSPKIAIDGVASDLPVPFTELARQPDYRGADNRRDYVSLVGSVDYIWAFAKYAAARIFVDAATVGPAVDELPLEDIRIAAGGGFELYSTEVSIARLLLAGSADGFHVHLSVGTPSLFGDRQHGD